MKNNLTNLALLLIVLFFSTSCTKDIVYTTDNIVGIYEGSINEITVNAEIIQMNVDEVNIKLFSENTSFETIHLNSLLVDVMQSSLSKTGRVTLTSWVFMLTNPSVISTGNVSTTSDSNDFTLSVVWPEGSFQGTKSK